MKKILLIKSSILGEKSISSQYSEKLLNKIKNNEDKIIIRDLDESPVMQLTSKTLNQLSNPNNLISQQYEKLIEEIKNVDKIIFAVPMYNFQIPASLKIYFDAITQSGKTFYYNENGQSVGLLTNKEVFVVFSRGGFYKKNNLTFVEDYLKTQFNFLGLTNIKYFFIEGVNLQENLEEQFENQLKNLI